MDISIAIYNSLGKCVLQTITAAQTIDFERTINIENLPPGFYSVQVQSAGKTIDSGKFIVSR
jgi:hypothetical protein